MNLKELSLNIIFKNIALLLLSAFLFHSVESSAQLSTIKARLIAGTMSGAPSDAAVTGYLALLKTDGSFSDINYADVSNSTTFPASNHTSRLRQMCILYNKVGSTYYHSSTLKAQIVLAFEYFYNHRPISVNWWFQAIGIPSDLSQATLLMATGDTFGFTQAQLDKYSNKANLTSANGGAVYYYTQAVQQWSYSGTGANQTWIIGNANYKACIENNDTEFTNNCNVISGDMRIIPGSGDGIKADGSFYQHGKLAYTAGYGLYYLGGVSNLMTLTNGTTFQLPDDKKTVMANILLDGVQWFTQGIGYDFGVNGREISRSTYNSPSSIASIIDNLLALGNVPRTAELTNYKSYVQNSGSNFQSPGNRHFWFTDFMVQHGAQFYLSARLASSRTLAGESMNGENFLCRYLGVGATNILMTGDEYRGLYPCWDWSRVPGVTCPSGPVTPYSTTATTYAQTSISFAGGVSNGTDGMAGYALNYDGVSGRKFYFFTDEAMYCLGAGITATKSTDVTTSINQTVSRRNVTVNDNGTESTFTGTLQSYTNLNWVHHANVGYYFPSKGNITVKNDNQTGKWTDISTSTSNPTTLNTVKTFSAWFSHGATVSNGTYEYIVVPNQALTTFKTWITTNPFSIISNTNDAQIVYNSKAKLYAAAFYNAGTALLENGLTVTVDKPCLLLIQSTTAGYKISVADPTQLLSTVVVKLSKVLSGVGSVNNADKTSTITVNLPVGDYKGQSVTNDYVDASISAVDQTIDNKRNITVFSNPTSTIFKVTLPNDAETMKVFDVVGKLMLTKKVTNSTESFGENWKSGTYILNVAYSNKTNSQTKLIKK